MRRSSPIGHSRPRFPQSRSFSSSRHADWSAKSWRGVSTPRASLQRFPIHSGRTPVMAAAPALAASPDAADGEECDGSDDHPHCDVVHNAPPFCLIERTTLPTPHIMHFPLFRVCWRYNENQNSKKRRPGVPLRALRKDLRRGFESWSRNHLLSSSAILPHPNAAIVATPC